MKKQIIIMMIFFGITLAGFAQGNKKHSERWRFNISGGSGYLTTNTSDGTEELEKMGIDPQKASDFSDDFNWGFQGNTDLHYLFNRNVGVGLKYSLFGTQASFSEDVPGTSSSPNSRVNLSMDETMYINYVGPSLFMRSFMNKQENFSIYTSLSVGYSRIRDEGMVKISQFPYKSSSLSYVATSNALGALISAGLEYAFTDHVSLGFDVGYFFANFKDFEVTYGQSQVFDPNLHDINASHLDLSLGLRFYY